MNPTSKPCSNNMAVSLNTSSRGRCKEAIYLVPNGLVPGGARRIPNAQNSMFVYRLITKFQRLGIHGTWRQVVDAPVVVQQSSRRLVRLLFARCADSGTMME